MRPLALAICALLAACDTITGGSELDKLRRNRDRWEALGIHDYDFHFQRSCYCGGGDLEPVRVEVRNAEISRVVSLRTGSEVVPSQYARWPSIDSLFLWTQRSFENGYNLDITYDATHRFPARVEGDLPHAVDDEFLHTATNFVRR
jgi:uncharacterized protein DUF6174